MTRNPRPPQRRARTGLPLAALVALAVAPAAHAVEKAATPEPARVARFREAVRPVLEDYCYGCHADGSKKGDVAFDTFASDEALVADKALWSNVLKNVRAGLMPPAGKPRPAADELKSLEDWVKFGALGIDPADPDPGRVTLRRLNRVEYRNTIRDLLGHDYRTDEEFPPDDTGYGFDNIGDVLTVSPLLLEKYMEAAEAIVTAAVPTVSRVVKARYLVGGERGRSGGANARGGEKLNFYEAATRSYRYKAEEPGTYRILVQVQTLGEFDFDPGKCRVVLKSGEKELGREELGWANGKMTKFEFTESWEPGDHPIGLELEPLVPVDQKKNSLNLRVASVVVEGPTEPERWGRPKNFDKLFTQDPPVDPAARKAYARDVLRKFAARAYRRPASDAQVDRLAGIAEAVYSQPGKTFEQGIGQALVAILASPRFLFLVEGSEPTKPGETFPTLDEYALASRLSYFLWSTMPDDALFDLAAKGELRKNLPAQVKRLLDDPRSEMFVENFTGQWLQSRDIEPATIDARSVLARDSGVEKALKEEGEAFRKFLAEREAAQREQRKNGVADKSKATQRQNQARNAGRFPNLFARPKVELDGEVKAAMRQETEMYFGSVVREDRSVLDLIDSDYTFLNEKLAKFYGIPDVTGTQMRKVTLPADSVRGGVLTQGTVLVVTSNPTRTSPVKRGLFLLDNVLGTPPPPPPPDIPQLEAAEAEFKDREPSLREVMEIHRSKPLCNSCHSRMDPLGLAFENFNAMGLFREKERNQGLDTAGKLITGEPFQGIRDLKKVLRNERRVDFYRCLTEKLLTYALGRGVEPTDVESVDRIVARLEQNDGKFSALLAGVIESAPFQKRRNPTDPAAAATAPVSNGD